MPYHLAIAQHFISWSLLMQQRYVLYNSITNFVKPFFKKILQFIYCSFSRRFLIIPPELHILNSEVINMSPKELTYIEDALSHEKFLKTQYQNAAQNLQDAELKQTVTQMAEKHQQIFDSFYHLV